MPFRHHYYCDACDGTWLVEAEVAIEGDCPFCRAHDVFPYRSDEGARAAMDAASMAKRVLEKMRSAVARPVGAEIRRAKRAAAR
jgi:hypothetical protein